MKRLDFSKSVTRRLTPGSNDYTNPNANPTRPSRHVIWTGVEITEGKLPQGKLRGRSPGEISGEITGENHRGEFTCFGRATPCFFPSYLFRRSAIEIKFYEGNCIYVITGPLRPP